MRGTVETANYGLLEARAETPHPVDVEEIIIDEGQASRHFVAMV